MLSCLYDSMRQESIVWIINRNHNISAHSFCPGASEFLFAVCAPDGAAISGISGRRSRRGYRGRGECGQCRQCGTSETQALSPGAVLYDWNRGAFFVLGLGASAAGSFFREQRMLFARIGGILIVLFGLYQLGVFGSSRLLGGEHRIPSGLRK